VYLLLKRILLTTGIKPMIRKCAKLRHEIARAAKSEDATARPRLMRSLIEAPILYLDDLGQMAASDSLGEALFDIIEERTQLGRPIIATSQSSGEEFTEKFNDANQGVALARRLSEFCYRVNFTRPKKLSKMEEPPLTLL
jgi:DNA replication protein DnaC